MTSALNNLNCLEAATVIHRQSITAKFTRSDVAPIVCEDYDWYRHGQIYILRTKLVLSMGDSDMTGEFEEQVTGERQMHDLRRNLACGVFCQAIKMKVKIVTSTECKS